MYLMTTTVDATNTDLETRIAAHLAVTKLGDKEWERTWSYLLSEKHGRARVPTLAELAGAVNYIVREFRLDDGRIDGEQWAEGLAFYRYAGDADDLAIAREALAQLPKGAWIQLAERANHISREQMEAPRYTR